MLENYFKIALRNILHYKAYSALNITGLAIGMACSMLILMWVQDELSYDRFHTNANQLYRLTCNAGEFKAAVSPAGMAPGLQKEMPEIKSVVRISKPSTNLFESGDRKFEEKRIVFADSNFFQEFSFPLLEGDPKLVLQHPDGMVITEDMARKYFGGEDAIGKVIRKNNQDNFIVTGIMKNVPANSHLQFDFILPMSYLATRDYDVKNSVWGNFNYYSYIHLQDHIDPASPLFPELLHRIKKIHQSHDIYTKVDFQLQPLTSIHLHSNLQVDLPGHGNIQYVNIFFIVALFILCVACINFMNLATARSARRSKEVGLRKVVGAGRYQLILQFLGESVIISLFSALVAAVIVYISLPAFNLLAGKELALNLLDGEVVVTLFIIALLTGLISGSYPALFLSGLKPVTILKGKLKMSGGNLLFRNGLVVTQFVVAIILLVGTAIVYKQLNFIKSKNLGFDKSNLVYMPMTMDLWGKQQALKSALSENTLTSNFSIISDLPTNLTTGNTDVKWDGKDPNSQNVIPSIDIDENFVRVFKLTLLNGRSFSKEFKGDSSNFVVNETSLRLMNMTVENAVGKSLSFDGRKGIIIGVIKNFNFKPLQYAIEPLVMRQNRWGGFVMVRTSPGKNEASIKALEQINHQLNPSYPFSYSFLDTDLDNLYRGERQMGSIFNLFAILAIFISCLGLYGLSAFMAEQRVKEIGVRKVLGASVFDIVFLLSQNFVKLIILAMIIAIPLAWLGTSNWLKGFVYRIDISWTIFLMASVTSIFIAWCTISYESIKAAIANPIKSLRNE